MVLQKRTDEIGFETFFHVGPFGRERKEHSNFADDPQKVALIGHKTLGGGKLAI